MKLRIVLAFALSAIPAVATVLPVRRYTTADGLARDSVHCILRDRDSFLWFATGEGISRFDGYGFVNYSVRDGLPDRDVRSIVQAQDGSFLIATGGGAARFDPNGNSPAAIFRVYALAGGPKVQSVRAVLDAEDAVWIGTDAGLFVAQNKTIQAFALRPGDPEPLVTSMARDADGNLWVGTSEGLFFLRKGRRPQRLIRDPIATIMADGSGVLVAVSGALVKIGQDLKSSEMKPSPGKRQVRFLLRGRDGTLWVGTASGVGKLTRDARKFYWLGEKDGLVVGDTQALAEGESGDLWVGYDGAGALRITGEGFLSYGERDGLPSSQIESMTLDSKGRLLVTTTPRPGMSVYRLENGSFIHHDLGLGNGYYPETWVPWHQVIVEDASGVWWTGSDRGLLRFDPSGANGEARLVSSITAAMGSPDNDVAHLLQDSKGNIWFSTLPIVAYPEPGRQSGLAVWERKTGHIRRFTELDGLPPLNSCAILYVFEDHAGDIWIGLYRNGVARYRNGRFQVFTPADGVPSGGIRYIYEDLRHHLWLGSGRGGLGRIDDPTTDHLSIHRYTAADGLASDEIQAITEDNFGRIYAGTGLGVDRLDLETQRIVHYTTADGLAEGEVQDAIRDRDGDLWFGTYKGISRFHPRQDPELKSLPTRISSVKVNGRVQHTTLGAGEVTLPDLPPGSNAVEIEYLALATSGPESILYQYRLNGGDGNWSAPAATRFVLYGNLRAGKYRFEVRSLGAAAKDTAMVRFTVLPRFWETWRFLALATAALLAVFYAVHRYRMANLLKLQQMRTRIANDLHDDIGSGLSKIVILSEVAQRQEADSQSTALHRIAEASREVLEAVGDLVWTTNASTETVEDLVRRMRSFATQMFEAKDVHFEMQVTEVPLQRGLSPVGMRQLYLIFKEAVNNAARHSQCTCARVELTYERGILIMRVCDDGVGFKPEPKPGHHGLLSLRARAASLGGTIEWHCGPGTTVELRVPLPV